MLKYICRRQNNNEKNVACKELNKLCRMRQDKISKGCNTTVKMKLLYLSLGSTELFTSVVILMTVNGVNLLLEMNTIVIPMLIVIC